MSNASVTTASANTAAQSRSATTSSARVPRRWRWLILGVLAVGFLGIGLQQAGQDAPTVDEGVDLSSGVNSLVNHDLRMVPEHPPLAKAAAALPALLARPIVPDTAAYRDGDWFDWSDDFISANEDAGRLRPMLLWARSVVLIEAVGCAALLYVLAKRFFGPDGGLLAAAAWLTTPYVVGLSHFAMIDIGFTLVTLGVCALLARWMDRPTMGAAGWLGLVLGVALATRHTGLVLVAVVVATMAWVLRGDLSRTVRQVLLTGLVAMAMVWLVYRGLAPSGPSGPVAARLDGLIATSRSGSPLSRLVTSLPLPLEWRSGFAYLDLTSTDRPASLFGQSWDGGRWWYFPASAALKLPLALVAAIVAGWVAAARTSVVRRRQLVSAVVIPGLALWLLLVAQPLNLGLRLAMPSVALAMVGLGGLVTLLRSRTDDGRHRWGGRAVLVGGVVALLAVSQVVASAAATPHSLAWTPLPSRPAHRWVSDANLDAGQAVYEVRDWAEGREPYVAIDTTRGLSVGGGSRPLGDVRPSEVRGWVAIGVTPLMQTRRNELAWLRKYCPVGTLGGGSVLLYRFDSEPDPAPGPERPVDACAGEPISRPRA